MSRPVLDLTIRHFTRELGDLTVIGTWLGPTPDDSEPCIVLMPTFRQALQSAIGGAQIRAKPCCIALSSAYLYDEPSYLLRRAMEFGQAMGFTDSMSTTHKIADAIHGSLYDLIVMPPRPVLGVVTGADATITDGWGRQTTVELSHNV